MLGCEPLRNASQERGNLHLSVIELTLLHGRYCQAANLVLVVVTKFLSDHLPTIGINRWARLSNGLAVQVEALECCVVHLFPEYLVGFYPW